MSEFAGKSSEWKSASLDQRSNSTPFCVAMCWSVLAILPLIAFYAAHLLQKGVPLGFVVADLPYYSANGREAFERGNGVAYPNPYDAAPDAPVIYFQWLIWLLGVGIVKFGFDPGIQFVVIGLFASVISAFLTFRVVEFVLPTRQWLGLLYLLTMWGGGVFVLFSIAANLAAGDPVMLNVTRLMPFGGWWFLSWGINHILPTEAVYHGLVAATWLMLLKNRLWQAVMFIAVLAATHPFSGLQHLIGVGGWLGLQFLRQPNLASFKPPFAVACILSVFLVYYFVYLPSFEAHSSLQNNWSLTWILTHQTLVFAYVPICAAAIYRLILDRDWLNPGISIFAVSFVFSFLLAKHELWTDPKQPIHFTHGYLWMPLCLIALPAIQQQLVALWNGGTGFRRTAVTAALIMVSTSDNIGWMFSEWPRHSGSQEVSSIEESEPFVLTEHQWEVIQFMKTTYDSGYVLCTDPEVSYLLPTYSPLNVYLGHFFNTPEIDRRRENVDLWTQTGEHDGWLEDITHIIIDEKTDAHLLSRQWRIVYSNPDYSIFQRVGAGRNSQ